METTLSVRSFNTRFGYIGAETGTQFDPDYRPRDGSRLSQVHVVGSPRDAPLSLDDIGVDFKRKKQRESAADRWPADCK